MILKQGGGIMRILNYKMIDGELIGTIFEG